MAPDTTTSPAFHNSETTTSPTVHAKIGRHRTFDLDELHSYGVQSVVEVVKGG